MTTFNIGIDTGGTYTDAVIVDTNTHEVIATAKSLTTRGRLEIGVSNALGDNKLNDLSISLKPTIPVVAVGGPAAIFYPQVGERLNVHSVIPHNAEVENAIGAAIGRIKIRTVIEITSSEAGGYHLHHNSKPLFLVDSVEALEQARQLASEYVEQKALSMGGTSAEINIQVERVDLPNMDKDRSLIAATVTAECLSSPAI